KTAVQQLKGQIDTANQSLREQENAFNRASRSFNSVGQRIQATGQAMQNTFAPAAAAFGYAFGRMINNSREFESQTRKAAVLTGGS
ncbi:hypothetical protein WAJ08_21980, partial [Acinetobacter baumannii]